jgi:hypothetical protein
MSEPSFTLMQGAILIRPSTSIDSYESLLFQAAYTSQKFLLNGDSPGFMGNMAYGTHCSVFLFIVCEQDLTNENSK